LSPGVLPFALAWIEFPLFRVFPEFRAKVRTVKSGYGVVAKLAILAC